MSTPHPDSPFYNPAVRNTPQPNALIDSLDRDLYVFPNPLDKRPDTAQMIWPSTTLDQVFNQIPLPNGLDSPMLETLREILERIRCRCTGDGGGGDTGLISVTFNQLVDLSINNRLRIGGRYLITDYRTIYIPIGAGPDMLTREGPLEPLIVTATSESEIAQLAISTIHSSDVVYYDFNDRIAKIPGLWNVTTQPGPGGPPRPGIINRRVLPQNNIDICWDWRVIMWPRSMSPVISRIRRNGALIRPTAVAHMPNPTPPPANIPTTPQWMIGTVLTGVLAHLYNTPTVPIPPRDIREGPMDETRPVYRYILDPNAQLPIVIDGDPPFEIGSPGYNAWILTSNGRQWVAENQIREYEYEDDGNGNQVIRQEYLNNVYAGNELSDTWHVRNMVTNEWVNTEILANEISSYTSPDILREYLVPSNTPHTPRQTSLRGHPPDDNGIIELPSSNNDMHNNLIRSTLMAASVHIDVFTFNVNNINEPGTYPVDTNQQLPRNIVITGGDVRNFALLLDSRIVAGCHQHSFHHSISIGEGSNNANIIESNNIRIGVQSPNAQLVHSWDIDIESECHNPMIQNSSRVKLGKMAQRSRVFNCAGVTLGNEVFDSQIRHSVDIEIGPDSHRTIVSNVKGLKTAFHCNDNVIIDGNNACIANGNCHRNTLRWFNSIILQGDCMYTTLLHAEFVQLLGKNHYNQITHSSNIMIHSGCSHAKIDRSEFIIIKGDANRLQVVGSANVEIEHKSLESYVEWSHKVYIGGESDRNRVIGCFGVKLAPKTCDSRIERCNDVEIYAGDTFLTSIRDCSRVRVGGGGLNNIITMADKVTLGHHCWNNRIIISNEVTLGDRCEHNTIREMQNITLGNNVRNCIFPSDMIVVSRTLRPTTDIYNRPTTELVITTIARPTNIYVHPGIQGLTPRDFIPLPAEIWQNPNFRKEIHQDSQGRIWVSYRDGVSMNNVLLKGPSIPEREFTRVHADMTSNTEPEPLIASASSVANDNFQAFNAFNELNGIPWLSGNIFIPNWNNTQMIVDQNNNLEIEFDEYTAVDGIIFQSSLLADARIIRWQLQGYVPGRDGAEGSWETVFDHNDTNHEPGYTYKFDLWRPLRVNDNRFPTFKRFRFRVINAVHRPGGRIGVEKFLLGRYK